MGVVTMYIRTDKGRQLQCNNAHASVGCPLLAGLLTSCPFLEGQDLGATDASSGAGKRKRRSSDGEATNGDEVDKLKRKRRYAYMKNDGNPKHKCPVMLECEGDCHEEKVEKCPHGHDI